MKKPAQRDRVRRWLEEHGSITNGDALHRMKPEIRRLSQRIAELQGDGLAIAKDWLIVDGRKTKEYQYTLEGGPKPKIVYELVLVDGVRMRRPVAVQPSKEEV